MEKSYYDLLFETTPEELALNEQMDVEVKRFQNSAEYKKHDAILEDLFNKLKEVQKKHRDEVKAEYKPNRKARGESSSKLDGEAFRAAAKKKEEELFASYSPEVVDLIKKFRNLDEEERRIVDRHTRAYHATELDNYENPITTEDDVKELQEILVQETIDFINERNLTDIDEVSFSADGLMSSAKDGKWTCSTDSFINVVGLQKDSKYGWVRRLIGKYF